MITRAADMCQSEVFLTHIWRMDFPIIINLVSPLSFLGASGVIFKFHSFFL